MYGALYPWISIDGHPLQMDNLVANQGLGVPLPTADPRLHLTPVPRVGCAEGTCFFDVS